jgi:hypothetical protein
MISDFARNDVRRYIVNALFNRAVLLFSDDSCLEFEHTSRSNRWARASAEGTTADRVCRLLNRFRLNAKHLQLFFEDGSDAEFFATPAAQEKEGITDGTSD